MPAPASAIFSNALNILAQTDVLAAIDAGAAAGVLKIYTEADTLLGTITLADPAGTVHGTTGQLTITAPSTVAAVATGTATWAEVEDSDGTSVVQIPVSAGASAVSGQCVLSSVSIQSGADLELISFTIG